MRPVPPDPDDPDAQDLRYFGEVSTQNICAVWLNVGKHWGHLLKDQEVNSKNQRSASSCAAMGAPA